MSTELPEVAVVERLVLHKFEGDLTDEEMETAQPVETIVVEKGEVIEHIIYPQEETNATN